jgi:hypothetical protein
MHSILINIFKSHPNVIWLNNERDSLQTLILVPNCIIHPVSTTGRPFFESFLYPAVDKQGSISNQRKGGLQRIRLGELYNLGPKLVFEDCHVPCVQQKQLHMLSIQTSVLMSIYLQKMYFRDCKTLSVFERKILLTLESLDSLRPSA